MTVGQCVETGSGVAVAADAAVAAAELARAVREATGDLPFDVEPASFLVALDALADTGDGE